MLDQLINLVKSNASEAIINNPAIPNEHNDSAIEEIANSILGGLKDQASAGNLSQIAGMFREGGALQQNPIFGQLLQTVTGALSSRFGVSGSQATDIASGMLPNVLNQLITKTNDPQDSSIDLQRVLHSVTGNSGLDVGSLLNNLGGSGSTPDLGDVLGNFLKR